MFEQIGRAIDDLIEDLCICIYRNWIYHKVYAPCFVNGYFRLHPEKLNGEVLEALRRCDYVTGKQYKRYMAQLNAEHVYLLAERQGMKEG